MSLENGRVSLWRNRWLIKSIVNLRRRRLPERNPNTKKGTTILDLPEDVIVNILLRLPVESLCRIQCVSKTSFDIARSPGFATLHTLCLLDPATNSDIFKFPQLIAVTGWSHKKNKHSVALQSLEYNSGKIKLTKTKQSALVSKICFGKSSPYYELEFVYCNLLCFYGDYGVPRLLVNPLRGEILKLPGSDIELSIYTWRGMGFDPVTNTYKIVKISARDDGNSLITPDLIAQILVLGTRSWRNKPLVSPCDISIALFSTSSSCHQTVYTHGYMHRLDYRSSDGSSHIISFNFNKEELHEISSPDLARNLRLKLLNLRGSLAIVGIGFHIINIWVLDNYDKKKWKLRHRINEMKPIFDLRVYADHAWKETCVEWEHGICFTRFTTCYFLDFRDSWMTRVELPKFEPSIFSREFWKGLPRYKFSSIFGYTESLISLKNYGRVIEVTKAKEGEWHIQ